MFGNNFTHGLDNWIKIEVPSDNMVYLTDEDQSKDLSTRTLRIRIIGSIESRKNIKSNEKFLQKPQIEGLFLGLSPIQSPDSKKYEYSERSEGEHDVNIPTNQSHCTNPNFSPEKFENSLQIHEKKEELQAFDENIIYEDNMRIEIISFEKSESLAESEKNITDSKISELNSLQISSELKQESVTENNELKDLQDSAENNITESKISELNDPQISNELNQENIIENNERKNLEDSAEKNILEVNALKELQEPIKTNILEVNELNDLQERAEKKITDEEEKKADFKKLPLFPKKAKNIQNFIVPDTYPSCPYLTTILNTEFNLKNTRKTLDLLKNDLGGQFAKFLNESKQRESRGPTRSPSRKSISSGIFTPGSSQKSLNTSMLSSFQVEEENYLEIPSNVDVSIERVSVKNLDSLIFCAIGLLLKKVLTKVQVDEILVSKRDMVFQENAKSVLSKSLKASEHELLIEIKDYDTVIEKMKQQNNKILEEINNKKKKNELLLYEKKKYDIELKRLYEEKEKILKNNSKGYIFDEIKQFYEANTKLEKMKIDLEEKIINSCVQYKDILEEITAEQAELLNEKKQLRSEIMLINQEIKQYEYDNHNTAALLQELSSKSYIDTERQEMLKYYEEESSSHSIFSNNLHTQLISLRSLKEDSSSETNHLHQKIEIETKSIKNSQIN